MKTDSANFIAKEESAARQPAELYHFWNEGGDHWYYTSRDVAITFDGNDYVSGTLQRTKVSYNSEIEVSTVSVTASVITEPTIEFIALNPVERIWIEISKIHLDMDPLEASKIFTGQIKNVSFKGVSATVECVGFEHFLKFEVPRMKYQAACNHTIYDARCGVDRENFKTTTTATVDSTGLVFTSVDFSALGDGYLTRGLLEFGDYKRMIVAHSGSALTIRYPITQFVSGGSVNVYAGCVGTMEACEGKFNNLNNFFGFPQMPLTNPITTGVSGTIRNSTK
ncbi:baseplate hub protein [Desulfobacter vibrioformis]|uniref:baseplate hub domain-containing protein n=1 Tax=Desulfobacter vibrioformis TaxID=34031 RepID=UPI000553E661|nr:DUF2163 domain-containing protein [Desulfobacter vibrioformis]